MINLELSLDSEHSDTFEALILAYFPVYRD